MRGGTLGNDGGNGEWVERIDVGRVSVCLVLNLTNFNMEQRNV